jgi:hypothetical protein
MEGRIGDGKFTLPQLHLAATFASPVVTVALAREKGIQAIIRPAGLAAGGVMMMDQRLGRTLEPGHGVRGGSWQRTVGRKNIKRYFANNVNHKMRFKRNFPTSCSHAPGA